MMQRKVKVTMFPKIREKFIYLLSILRLEHELKNPLVFGPDVLMNEFYTFTAFYL